MNDSSLTSLPKSSPMCAPNALEDSRNTPSASCVSSSGSTGMITGRPRIRLRARITSYPVARQRASTMTGSDDCGKYPGRLLFR